MSRYRRCSQGFTIAIAVVIACLGPIPRAAASSFVRGDANGDGVRNISDAVFMLGCSFLGSGCSTCADAADVNDDGATNVTDPVFLLNFLFGSGPVPPVPTDECGVDPTVDDLECGAFELCAELPDLKKVSTCFPVGGRGSFHHLLAMKRRADLILTPLPKWTIILNSSTKKE